MRNVVDVDVALEVACHEAIVRQAYKDSVGVWTWSVGLTDATGHLVSRYIGKPQPLQHCLNVYVWALENYARQVDEVFAGHRLSRTQFAAALSFHWNTGAIRRATWVRHFKAGDRAAARRAFMAWSKPPEIVARRQKECDLFFDGRWSHRGTMTEITRLNSKSRPIFSSARRIDVSAEMRAAFAARPTTMDLAANPDRKPEVPTLSLGDYTEVMLAQTPPPPDVEPITTASLGPKHGTDLKRSRTIRGAAIQGVGAAGTGVTQAVAENINETASALSPITHLSMWITGIFVAMILGGFALTTYARMDDAGMVKKGDDE